MNIPKLGSDSQKGRADSHYGSAQARLGISDPSCRVFTLVAQLGLGSESEPSMTLNTIDLERNVGQIW